MYSPMILFKNICTEYLEIAESKSVVFFFNWSITALQYC